jgi:hypothetical protein
MMALDPLNNLKKNIKEINVTGSNTDPLLYRHIYKLTWLLRQSIPGVRIGLRTNGVLILSNHKDLWTLYDKVSISVTSLDPELYTQTMGMGTPPNLEKIIAMGPTKELKLNVVLCPETVQTGDIFQTIAKASDLGIKRINLREPYGQPCIGDPLKGILKSETSTYGMPTYKWGSTLVTYWDVHFVEVESINLYANGIVSTTYPVSKGHCPDTGKVLDQGHFNQSGRIIEQWNYKEKNNNDK